ncbi:MAG: tetratricopeptide repeat protein [Cyanobacteria bacterium J06638_28]
MCLQELLCLLQTAHLSSTQPPQSLERSCLLATAQQAFIGGIQHHQQQQFEQALGNFEVALHKYTQAQDGIGIGKTLNQLSAVYLQTQNYSRSLTCSQAAIAILEATPNQPDYALATYQLGISHLKRQEFDSAEPPLDEALSLYYEMGDMLSENRVLLHLGQLYAERHEYMFALAAYESVLENMVNLAAQPPVQSVLFDVLRSLWQLCEATNCAEEARGLYQAVLEHYGTAVNSAPFAQVLRQLGKFYESQQRYTLALDCYKQALEIAPPDSLSA